jgi:hypothetical protein
MATDYDAPRASIDDDDEPITEFRTSGRARRSTAAEEDRSADIDEALDLSGADLSELTGEDLIIRVLPRQADELLCTSCFLVFHRSHRPRPVTIDALLCRDCA